MTDYKYLKENNLLEAHHAFMRMCEGYGYSPIEEAGEEEDPQGMGAQNPQGAPDMGAQNPQGGPDMGMDSNAMGGDPNAMGGDPNGTDGGPNAMDPNAMGVAPMADPSGADTMGPEDPMMGDDGLDMGDEETEEIDVDQMTDAQQKTFDRVNDVGKDLNKTDNHIEKLLGAIKSMSDMIEKNNGEIENLKREFEKRNPTQTEKLNLKSLDSYPFNIRPTDYWADKEKTSNYSAYADNDKPTTDEYVITNDDVDDFSDREIADSFDVDDPEKVDMKRIFGL